VFPLVVVWAISKPLTLGNVCLEPCKGGSNQAEPVTYGLY
jgi:hypothetical protein